MHSLSASELLDVWDRAAGERPLVQALVLLQAAYPQASWDELTQLSVGERDRRLLALRAAVFGDDCKVFAECPLCATGLEFSLSASQLANQPQLRSGDGFVEVSPYTVGFRLPNSSDLIATSDCQSIEEATLTIFQRCLLEIRAHEKLLLPGEVPADLTEKLLDRFKAWLDLQETGETLLHVTCPACGHAWDMLFDPATFVWREIERLAKKLIAEVATLAGTFGWSEQEILKMSGTRRMAYLNCCSTPMAVI